MSFTKKPELSAPTATAPIASKIIGCINRKIESLLKRLEKLSFQLTNKSDQN